MVSIDSADDPIRTPEEKLLLAIFGRQYDQESLAGSAVQGLDNVQRLEDIGYDISLGALERTARRLRYVVEKTQLDVACISAMNDQLEAESRDNRRAFDDLKMLLAEES